VRNFYNSETFAMLKELPQENWLEIEDFSFFLPGGKEDMGRDRLQLPHRRRD
jgi:hypothetical protein